MSELDNAKPTDYLGQVLSICHVSDNHSAFIPLSPGAEVIVHTGDLLPNASRGNRNIEPGFQERWVRNNIEKFKKWLDGRPFIYTAGNHDFLANLVEILCEHGMEAYDINNRRLEFRGFNFYGFPYINYICGEWNYELTSPEMHSKIRELKDNLSGVDILCAHSPPYNILDSTYVFMDSEGNMDYSMGARYGNQHLADLITYKWDEIENPPRYILVGHCHDSHFEEEKFGIYFSNAATTSRLIKLEK